MSTPSSTPPLVPDGVADSMTAAVSNYEVLFRPLEALGFWAAVVLPFVYVPLIVAGVHTTSEAAAVAVLVTVHVLALVVGHRYRLDE